MNTDSQFAEIAEIAFTAILTFITTRAYYIDRIRMLEDMVDYGWSIIANGWEGWSEYYENTNARAREWIAAAKKWRDQHYDYLMKFK